MTGDTLALVDDPQPGRPLLQTVMRGGQRLAPSPTAAEIRDYTAGQLARLPPAWRQLDRAPSYPVNVADSLRELAQVIDRSQEATNAAS